MQLDAKVTCYQELYARLKESDFLSDFGWPSEKEHLDFYFKIGNTKVDFRLFSNKDMMKIRSKTPCLNFNDEESIAFAQKVSKNFYGIFGNVRDGNFIFKLSVPFPSVSDDVAKQLIIDKSNYFINMIMTQLEMEYVKNIKEVKDSEEESTEKIKKKKISFSPIKLFNSKKTPENNPTSEVTMPENESDLPKENDSLNDLSDNKVNLHKNVLEEPLKSEDLEEVSITNTSADTINEKLETCEEPEILADLQINSCEDGKKNIESEKKIIDNSIAEVSLKEKTFEESKVVEKEPESDLYENKDTEEIQKENNSITDTMVEKTELLENLDVTAGSETNFYENDNKNIEKALNAENTIVDTMDEAEEDLKELEENEINKVKSEHISELYESMNRTFDMKKAQLDYREQMLSEQKQLLKHEKEFIQNEKLSIEAQQLEIKEKEDSLKKNWDQYKKAKKRQNQILEKTSDREKKVRVLEESLSKRIEKINEQEVLLSTREQEITEKIEKIELSWKEYQEKESNIQNYEERLKATKQELAENEMKLDMQRKQNALERQIIEDKLADLKETEEMIEELKKKSGISSFTENSKELNSLKEELNKFEHQTKLLQKGLLNKSEEINKIMQQLEQKKQEYADLKNSYDNLKNLSLKNEQEENSSQIEFLQKHIEDLEMKNQDTETKYHKKVLAIQDQYDSLLREHGVLKEKLETATGGNVVSELMKGGYIATNGKKNNRDLLTFSLGNCNVWIDEERRIVEIEKETRKNYIKQMQELNDITYDASFCVGKGKIYCRFVYNDIVKELRENISIMIKFK